MPLQYGHPNLSTHPKIDAQSGKSNLQPPTAYYGGANLLPVSNHSVIVAQLFIRIVKEFVQIKQADPLHYGNANVSVDPSNVTWSTHPYQPTNTMFYGGAQLLPVGNLSLISAQLWIQKINDWPLWIIPKLQQQNSCENANQFFNPNIAAYQANASHCTNVNVPTTTSYYGGSNLLQVGILLVTVASLIIRVINYWLTLFNHPPFPTAKLLGKCQSRHYVGFDLVIIPEQLNQWRGKHATKCEWSCQSGHAKCKL